MEIKLINKNTVDVFSIKDKIYWNKLDFSFIQLLKGNKDLLEKTFQEVKRELNG